MVIATEAFTLQAQGFSHQPNDRGSEEPRQITVALSRQHDVERAATGRNVVGVGSGENANGASGYDSLVPLGVAGGIYLGGY